MHTQHRLAQVNTPIPLIGPVSPGRCAYQRSLCRAQASWPQPSSQRYFFPEPRRTLTKRQLGDGAAPTNSLSRPTQSNGGRSPEQSPPPVRCEFCLAQIRRWSVHLVEVSARGWVSHLSVSCSGSRSDVTRLPKGVTLAGYNQEQTCCPLGARPRCTSIRPPG